MISEFFKMESDDCLSDKLYVLDDDPARFSPVSSSFGDHAMVWGHGRGHIPHNISSVFDIGYSLANIFRPISMVDTTFVKQIGPTPTVTSFAHMSIFCIFA